MSAERSAASRRRREDERRQALLQAALEVFDQAGYGGGSLDQVIERVGGSRRAIYSLFGSKRALFAAMVTELSDRAVEAFAAQRIEGRSADAVLLEFGRRFLTMLTERTSLALYRAMVAEGARFPELAATFFERGPGRAGAQLADVLDDFARRGALRLPEPAAVAAGHFIGMLRGDLHLRVVLGLRPAPDGDEIDRAVRAAVALFLDGCRAPAADPSAREGAAERA